MFSHMIIVLDYMKHGVMVGATNRGKEHGRLQNKYGTKGMGRR